MKKKRRWRSLHWYSYPCQGYANKMDTVAKAEVLEKSQSKKLSELVSHKFSYAFWQKRWWSEEGVTICTPLELFRVKGETMQHWQKTYKLPRASSFSFFLPRPQADFLFLFLWWGQEFNLYAASGRVPWLAFLWAIWLFFLLAWLPLVVAYPMFLRYRITIYCVQPRTWHSVYIQKKNTFSPVTPNSSHKVPLAWVSDSI